MPNCGRSRAAAAAFSGVSTPLKGARRSFASNLLTLFTSVGRFDVNSLALSLIRNNSEAKQQPQNKRSVHLIK